LNNHIVISGCSGGGKSTLLDSLQSQGYKTIQEAGRRVVAAEVELGSEALPWKNMPLFLERAIDLASEDLEKVHQETDPVFLIEASSISFWLMSITQAMLNSIIDSRQLVMQSASFLHHHGQRFI